MKALLALALFALLPLDANAQHEVADGIAVSVNLFPPNDRVACHRIPSLVTAPNEDLIAVVDERVPDCSDLKSNPDINLVLRRSDDGGATWSDVVRLVDHPLGQSASDASMIVDHETGTVLLFYNYMDLEAAQGIYRAHVMRSGDNGRTWTEPVDITDQITKPAWRHDFQFITSGRGVQTRSGRLLHTLVNLDRGMHVFGSDDHGATWFLLDVPIVPADESKIIELADGRLMINSRVNGAGYRVVHVSDDGGRSWSTRPEPALVDPGCNASLLRTGSHTEGDENEILLFANATSADVRRNLTVRTSPDDGHSWMVGKTVYTGSSAYASMTLLMGGDVGLLFEKDDYTDLRFVRFSLDWLTDGPESRDR